MEISRYPDLSLVKEEPLSPCLSPVLPMLPAPDGKGKRTTPILSFLWSDSPYWHQMFMNELIFHSPGTEIKLQDIKTEPSSMFFGPPFGPISSDSKQGLVSVAITLRPAAAEVTMI